jgi:hypothetical protein
MISPFHDFEGKVRRESTDVAHFFLVTLLFFTSPSSQGGYLCLDSGIRYESLIRDSGR